MDDFLAKPINIEKLMATLGHWLARGSNMPEAAKEAEVAQVTEAAPAPQAAIASQESGPPVFDEETLLAQLGGDRELAKAIILSATEDMPGYFEQLEQAVAAGNWKTAARQTHTLKGLTAQIGGMKLSVRMKALDDHLKGGGDTDSATVAALRSEYQLLSVALAGWMAPLVTKASAPAGKPPAIDQMVAIYRDLDALLSQNKFDAVGRIKDLQVLVTGTQVSADIAEAGRMITEFRFDLARGQLQRIAAQQGWEIGTS